MITRKEYIEKSPPYAPGQVSEIFRAYYGQFVSNYTKKLVIAWFGIDRLLASQDVHFKDIPLSEWDQLAGGSGSPSDGLHYNPPWAPLHAMKEAGDYYTLAGGVCILKEAARLVCEEYLATKARGED